MAKLIQICASQDDLFGLDEDGTVYQYNFSTKNWTELGRGRHDHGPSPIARGETGTASPGAPEAGRPARREGPRR